MNKIYLNHPGNSTVILILAPTGSANEYDDIKGISHYLEHVCFKGTKTRTAKQLASEIEGVGGDLNAFTSYELTCYWAKVPNEHKKIATNVIEDLVCNPLLKEEDIEKERSVILQELKMREDHPHLHIQDLFYKTMFDKKCKLHLPVIGTRKTLPNISRAEIIDYYKLKYDPLTMIVIGDVKDEELIEHPVKKEIEVIPRKNSKDYYFFKKGGIKQAKIIIGNIKKTPNFKKTSAKFIVDILSGVFNDMSGRLFIKLREEQNLCYNINFFADSWGSDYILWGVGMGLDKKNIEFAREMVISELNREILNEELHNSFIKCCGSHQLDLDDGVEVAKYIAEDFNDGLNWKDYIIDYKKKLEKATVFARDFVKEIDFNDNKVIGIVPYEK